MDKKSPSLKLAAKAPENGWLEYDPFLLGRLGLFSGAIAVNFREGMIEFKATTWGRISLKNLDFCNRWLLVGDIIVIWVAIGSFSQNTKEKQSFEAQLVGGTWRIIPVSKSLVTTIYKPFRPLIRGTTLLRGLTNHGY